MGSTYSTPEPVKEKAALAKMDMARTSIEPDLSTRDTRPSWIPTTRDLLHY